MSGCERIQELLAEGAGDGSRLPEPDRAHLIGCASCRAVASAESRLADLLAAAVPPADPAFERRVMLAVRARRRRLRLAALLPVAASLLVAAAGAVLAGGVPGGGLLGLLPRTSSQGWLALAGAAGDWVVAVGVACRAAQLGLPPLLPVAALAAAVSGLTAIVIATRRWRALVSWPVRG